MNRTHPDTVIIQSSSSVSSSLLSTAPVEQQLRVSVFYVFQLKLSTYLYLVSLRINNLTFHVLELALFQISSVVDCKTYSKKTVVTMPTLYVSHSLVWFSNKCEVCLITINFYHLRKQTRCCPNENKNHVIMKTAYRFYMYIVLAFQSCYLICHSTRCKLRHCVLPVIKQAIHQRKMWLIKGKRLPDQNKVSVPCVSSFMFTRLGCRR